MRHDCLSIRLSIPGSRWLVPGSSSRRLTGPEELGGLQRWVVSQGALLYRHFSKYSLMWLLASACRRGFKPETLSVGFVLPASAHLGGVSPATVLNPQCTSTASQDGCRHLFGLDPKSWIPWCFPPSPYAPDFQTLHQSIDIQSIEKFQHRDGAGGCGLPARRACAAVPEGSNVAVVWYLPALLCAGTDWCPPAEPAVSGEDARCRSWGAAGKSLSQTQQHQFAAGGGSRLSSHG